MVLTKRLLQYGIMPRFKWRQGSEWSSMYGILVEGDQGTLTFQGARYLGFERNSPSQSV
ncbi:hypothetical protein [Fictibacillus sp. 23RED33]|uniref:hypothetical protein n=1 Tax=Fictibacillus sp. 23RED33 TaxID=2745879 RepID=UPI0018CD8B6E